MDKVQKYNSFNTIKGGHPAWGAGEGLKIPRCKRKTACYQMLQGASEFRGIFLTG